MLKPARQPIGYGLSRYDGGNLHRAARGGFDLSPTCEIHCRRAAAAVRVELIDLGTESSISNAHC